MATVCFLTDIHGNVRALRAAADAIARRPTDLLVIGGDLLTYGPDPVETLDLVDEMLHRHHAEILIGNHDQIYFDLVAGDARYYSALPDWLKESVDWTASRIDLVGFERRYRWRREFVLDDVLFAHANPFSFGDWRYLNTESTVLEADQALRQRGFKLGIFGHTHRGRCFRVADDGSIESVSQVVAPTVLGCGSSRFVLTAGALGQPRETGAVPTVMRLALTGSSRRVTLEPVSYDVAGHVEAIEHTGLSESAVGRLRSFFV